MVLTSTSVHVVEGASKNGCFQCLYSQGELHLPPASLGDSDPGSSQIISPALGP